MYKNYVIAERLDRHYTEPIADNTKQTELLLFRAGRNALGRCTLFGIDARKISDIITAPTIAPTISRSPYHLGAIRVNNENIPVLDLSLILSYKPTQKSGIIMMIRHAHITRAFTIDSYEGTVHVATRQMTSAGSLYGRHGFITNIARIEADDGSINLVLVMDIDAALLRAHAL